MESYQAIYDGVRSRISQCDVGAAVADVARYALDFSTVKERAQEQLYAVALQMQRPSVLYRPSIYPDGTQWCCLLGEDLMTGVVGFGDTPEQAAAAFDQAWLHERTPDAKLAEAEDNAQFGVGA